MIVNSIVELIANQLKYNPAEPLIFSSGFFIFFFTIFAYGYSKFYNKINSRVIYVSLFSLYFYYKTSGLFVLLLIFLSLSDFILGYFIHYTTDKSKKRTYLIASIVTNLSILFYFKYTGMFAELWNNITGGNLDFSNIFLPIGISFFTFQSMSYTIDLYRGEIKPLKLWIDYLFYLSFFPQLVAGPIVRAKDFLPQIARKEIVVTRHDFTTALFLIMSGLFKKAIISDYISINFVDRVFDAPLLYTGFENLIAVYGYAIQIYCDFSGYSDIAIGIALILGFRFNENFNSPYKSATITEFWRRWHISLSSWLRDYLYISLGGNRKGKMRTYINLMITMLLGGLWHGAQWKFVVWGMIHGVSLALHKACMTKFPTLKSKGSDMNRINRVISIILTFNLVLFAWIFFRANSYESAWQMIEQIVINFNISILLDFITSYKTISLLLVIAFVSHFVSDKIYKAVVERFTKLPIAIYPLLFALLIWLIMQMRSGEIQPFIYFQF